MRWVFLLLLLVGELALLVSGCEQPLFPVIPCEDQADCEMACEEACASVGEEVESAECDANFFCDCLCMPAQ